MTTAKKRKKFVAKPKKRKSVKRTKKRKTRTPVAKAVASLELRLSRLAHQLSKKTKQTVVCIRKSAEVEKAEKLDSAASKIKPSWEN